MIVLPGPASQILGIRVAEELKADAVPVFFKNFPDGDTYIRVEGEVDGEHVVVVQSTYPPQDKHLTELYLLLEAAKDHGAEKITAFIPYLAYSRQDKRFLPGEALSAKTICRLIASSGADEVYTVDIHAEKVLDYFGVPAKNLTAMPLLAEYFAEFGLTDPLIIAPDKGALWLAESFAQGINADYTSFEKSRDRITGESKTITKMLQASGRDVVIVDDIISTGGTVVSAVNIVREQGAADVYVGCTHPFLMGDARTKILNAGAKSIVGTDTIPCDVSLVSVSPLLVKALRE